MSTFRCNCRTHSSELTKKAIKGITNFKLTVQTKHQIFAKITSPKDRLNFPVIRKFCDLSKPVLPLPQCNTYICDLLWSILYSFTIVNYDS